MSESDPHPGKKRETALLSWIQQNAPYGVITLDLSFHIQSWNRWMELHSGLRTEEVIGKDLFMLYPGLRERKLVGPFERALNGESSVLSTALHRYLLPLPSPLRQPGIEHMRQTARITPLQLEGVVCGIVVVIEDVTQRESQAEALSRQHRRDEILSWALAFLLNAEDPKKSIRQLFFKIAEYLDFDTFLLYFRDLETGKLVLYATGGVSADMEKVFSDYPLLTDVANTRDIVVFNSVKKHRETEYSFLQKAGISAAVAIPLFANEHSLGLLCFASWNRESIAPEESDLLATIAQFLATAVDRENTRRQLQKAREQLVNHAQLLEKKVEERTARLQETISELETFSYTLAHDLKAPVRGMIGYCEVLLEDFSDSMPEEANLIVQKLVRTPQRMKALIDDLLRFSEVSRQEVIFSRVELEPIIENIIALRIPAVRRAITIISPLHPVRGHPALLHQVLANLVDNAIKFVRPGTEPKITISTEFVPQASPSTRSRPLLFNSTEPVKPPDRAATSEPAPQRVRISVRDEGIGIPASAHQKIFGIFERGVTLETYEGTGMGLAIVARALQRMGGTCGVESVPEKGSHFWIELQAG